MDKALGKKTDDDRDVDEGKGGPGYLHNSYAAGNSPKTFIHRSQKSKYYLAASISLITFVVYLSTLRNDFVIWDDDVNVMENIHIQALDIVFYKWAFLDFSAPGADYWRPLSFLSHALDYAIWGLNPIGHHLTNNILHAINTFLVVVLVVRLIHAVHDSLPTVDGSHFTLIASGVTGFLFALHPLHVESVAWVSERKDLLCALFFLLSIIAYTRYATVMSTRRIKEKLASRFFTKQYLLAIGFFVLALMSKPMAVSLPFVLLIMDWYPFKRMQSIKSLLAIFIEKIPFIALSVVVSSLTFMAQKAGGTMTLMEFVPLSTRLLLASKTLVVYLWKMILPLNLSPYYPYPESVLLLSVEYLLPVILVFGITALCFVFVNKQKLWLSAWLYYLMTLIPVLGIVQVGRQAMADRYTYLPSLGPFLILGLAAARILMKVKASKRSRLVLAFLNTVIAILVFFSMAFLTVKQISIWKDSISLWSYVIEEEHERVPVAYVNRGAAFAKMGQLDKAITDLDKGINLNPSDIIAYRHRAKSLFRMGQFGRAVADYDMLLALNPSDYDAYVWRNITISAYVERGNFYMRQGEKDLAIADFKKGCKLGNNGACLALKDLGMAMEQQKYSHP